MTKYNKKFQDTVTNYSKVVKVETTPIDLAAQVAAVLGQEQPSKDKPFTKEDFSKYPAFLPSIADNIRSLAKEAKDVYLIFKTEAYRIKIDKVNLKWKKKFAERDAKHAKLVAFQKKVKQNQANKKMNKLLKNFESQA